MSIVDEQFAELQRQGVCQKWFAEATLTHLSNGTAIIHLRDYGIPQGWDRRKVNLYFVVPIGYPVARPDTFWVDADLRLASGAQPTSTGRNAADGVPANLLWFSWHASTWNPNQDKLVTYVAMIARRFEQLR